MKIRVKRMTYNDIAYFLLLFWLWTLFAYNTFNVDRENYITLYQYTKLGIEANFDKGFMLFYRILNYMNLSFEMVQIITATFVLGCISLVIKKYAISPFFSLLLYGIFPFTIDTIQIRNSMGYSFVLLAFLALIENEKKNNRKKAIIYYILFVFIGSLFHSLMIVYLIFLLLYLKTDILNLFIIIGIPIEIGLYLLLPKWIMFVGRIYPKVLVYWYGGGWNTRLTSKILFLGLLLFMVILYKSVSKYYSDNILFKVGYAISRISCIFLFVFYIEVDFFRIYRNIFMLMMIPLYNSTYKMENARIRLVYRIVLFVLSIMMCYAFIQYQSTNIENLFMNNSFYQ